MSSAGDMKSINDTDSRESPTEEKFDPKLTTSDFNITLTNIDERDENHED